MPINTGNITEVSACGMVIPKGASNGLTKKLIAKPNTQTQAVAGRHDD